MELKGRAAVIERFKSIGIELEECRYGDRYDTGEIANYYVKFDGMSGVIWVKPSGELAHKYTTEQFRQFIEQARER